MWNDIVIGEGDKGNSATIIRDMPSTRFHISHNQNSYWVSNAYLGTNLTIFKDSSVGNVITHLLKDKVSDLSLTEYFDNLVISHIDPKMLKRKVDALVKAAFDSGRAAQAQIIRDALSYTG